MLKRANIALTSAGVPGFLAYTGLFDAVTPAAKVLFMVLLGFAVVSFLLSLFEDEEAPASIAEIKAVQPALALDDAQLVRVAP